MKIVLATGIYPPDIGGPATYTEALAHALTKRNHNVTVMTYGRDGSEVRAHGSPTSVVVVSKRGSFLSRWMRYRSALLEHGKDADVIIALTSVSVGIPLLLAGLKTPKKVLRLGGEFFWERATDAGSLQSLRSWYRSWFGFWRIVNAFFMEGILTGFDGIVYSTSFQREIHAGVYRGLPRTTVIENAVPQGTSIQHALHDPMRLLFMGRFVHFKNLPMLLDTMTKAEDCTLTLVGDGPMKNALVHQVGRLGLQNRVKFLPPVHGSAKAKIFNEHDLLVIPSITEISPNVALEARAAGLPVLLTEETGLSDTLSNGMVRAPMKDPLALLGAIMKVRARYVELAPTSFPERSWCDVTDEWESFLSNL